MVKYGKEHWEFIWNGRSGKHVNATAWTAERVVHGSIECNNGVFGDPLHNVKKECRCRLTSM